MESQSVINVALGLIAFLGGWVVRNLQESMTRLRVADESLTAKVQAMEVLVAGTYVKREDLDKLSSALFTKLDRIESKVDTKMSREEFAANGGSR